MNKAEAVQLADEIVLLLIDSDGGRAAPELVGGIRDRLDRIRTAFPRTSLRCAEVEDTTSIYFSPRATEYFDAKGAVVSQAAGLLMALKAEH